MHFSAKHMAGAGSGLVGVGGIQEKGCLSLSLLLTPVAVEFIG